MTQPENRLPVKIETATFKEVDERIYRTIREDKKKVALIIDESDITMLIDALCGRVPKYGTAALDFAEDLVKLRQGVYGR